MMQVRNTTDLRTRPSLGTYTRHFFGAFLPYENLVLATRAIGVFVLAVGIVMGGGLASAQVYRDAAPGEMFYGMKLAVERVQLVLAPNQEYRTRLHLEYADRRMDEVSRLAEGSAADQEYLTEVLAGLERELAGLRDGLADLKGSDPEGVVEVAKLLERKMAIYHNGLRKASDYVSPRLRISLLAAMDTVDGVSITSMAVIVEKHLAGDEQAPRRVVVSKFEERLRVAEEKLGALPVADEAEGPAVTSRVRSSLAEAKQLLEKEDYQAALSKIVEVAELTKEAEQEILEEETEAEAAAEEAVETEEDDTETTEEETADEAEPTEEEPPADDDETADVPTGSSDGESDDAAGSGSR
ncbi:hypothetical protein AMJ57_05405 [Parcubacteria bacterium SG8_24]|nr:MAG: hypothetical protein AMJ57_05405 [Parcubacteria bacterium SG8_24]